MLTHLAACLAVDHGVGGKAFTALQVGEGLDGPPGLQIARHSHRRPHLQPIVHTWLYGGALVLRLVLGLLEGNTHTKNICISLNMQTQAYTPIQQTYMQIYN